MVVKAIPLAIASAGMVTATGLNWPTTCAAIRAGVSGIREDNLWDPTTGTNLQVGRPRTFQWWEGPDMLAELAAPAVVECLDAATAPADQVPILLLLSPPGRPHRSPNLALIVQRELERLIGGALPKGSKVFEEGSTGILSAYEESSVLIGGGLAEQVIVVGVESFMRQVVVGDYIENSRIHTTDNSNGFVPGEAACAILFQPVGHARGNELRVVGWGGGHEQGAIITDTPVTGGGLTYALEEALKIAGKKFDHTHYWLTDQNGEAYKFRESTIAQIRLERRIVPPTQRFPIWHPIEYVGEIGAAIGPHLLGLALYVHQHRYAPGNLGLVHVTEDAGDRVAFVLQWISRD